MCIDVADKGSGLCGGQRYLKGVFDASPAAGGTFCTLEHMFYGCWRDRLSGGDAGRGSGVVDGAGRGRCTRRGRGPAADPSVVDHDEPDLRASRGRRRPRRAPARRRVGRARSDRDVVCAARHLRPGPRCSPAAAKSRPNTPRTPGTRPARDAARRGRDTARFGVIGQVWLHEAIKRWSRFRLSSGYSFNTIEAGAQVLGPVLVVPREHPEVTGFDGITRDLLDDFLSWMSTAPPGPRTPATTR